VQGRDNLAPIHFIVIPANGNIEKHFDVIARSPNPGSGRRGNLSSEKELRSPRPDSVGARDDDGKLFDTPECGNPVLECSVRS
jgi:hypothetical protein